MVFPYSFKLSGEKLRASQESPSGEAKVTGVGGCPPPMGTPYQAVCPQIEQDRGDELSVFSNPGGFPTISSILDSGHSQIGAPDMKQQGRNREMVVLLPNLLFP